MDRAAPVMVTQTPQGYISLYLHQTDTSLILYIVVFTSYFIFIGMFSLEGARQSPVNTHQACSARLINSPFTLRTRNIVTNRSHIGICRASSGRRDEVLRTLSENGQVSVVVVDGTALVQDACNRHQTAPTASAALGRTILGTLMMSCFRGQGEKTQVTFKGDGPFGTIQVVSESSGLVKGLIGNPNVNFPLRESDNKLDVSQGVGKGILSVVRSLPFTEKGYQTPYTGLVPITTGEIAEDLATYLADSEQTQSALGLGVSVGRDLKIDAAGGFLIQVLPFAEDETISQLEANVSKAGSMSRMLKDGLSPKEITDILLEGLGTGGEGFSLTPRYGPCEPEDLKGRMASAVAALGEDEVRDIIKEQGMIEVTCEFCKQSYKFEEDAIMEIINANKQS